MRSEDYSQTILIVDDSDTNRAILSAMLGPGYVVLEAEDGEQAVHILKEREMAVDLVLLDVVMPGMDGFQVLEEMKKQGWTGVSDLPVIMISAEKDVSFVERAYDLGATDYISRPFDVAVVRRRVENTLMLYAKQKKLSRIIAKQVRERERDSNRMINLLSHIVEFRNGESGQHVRNIRFLTELLLRHLMDKTDRYVLTQEEISLIGKASSLHDIGKISVPDEILNKPGKLLPEEFEVMKTHSAAGADMLRGLPDFQNDELVKFSYEICRWHHERYDGKGYPDGLEGEDIPIAAQAVALADVYDTLTGSRCYKQPFSHEEALQMILDGECGAFNPLLIECLEEAADVIRDQSEAEVKTSPDEKRMDYAAKEYLKSSGVFITGAEFTGAEIVRLMNQLREVFDIVRLVDAEKALEMEVGKDGTICAAPHLCHAVWNREKRCENCISAKVLAQKAQRTKFEFRGKEICFVIAKYVEVDGIPYSLELVSKIEDEILSGAYGMEDFVKTITSYNEELYIDSLTGVYNRRYFEEHIKEMGHIEGIAMADVDEFKSINDVYGHYAGDEALCTIASTIKKCLRHTDIVLRYGGDEFLILFQRISEEGFARKICQMEQAVAEAVMDGKPEVHLSVSIGGAYMVYPVSRAVGMADEKMYEKKRKKCKSR